MGRGAGLAAGAAGLGLLAAAPAPAVAVAALVAPTSAPDPFAPLLSLLALVAWALLSWVTVIALASSATRLPGGIGRAAACVARRIAPAAIRRVVEVALGLTVTVGTVGAVGTSPASAGTHAPPGPAAAVASLDWPTPSAPAPAPPLDWPTPSAPSLDWNPTPSSDWNPTPVHQRAAQVVVEPGDSLWAIAADHLPAGAKAAQIAHAWPAWWSANRTAIGADPDLIHAGLSLTPPR